MTSVARIVAIGSAVAMLSAPALAQKVTYDTNRTADFSQVRTYSFKEGPPIDAEAYKTTAYDSPIVRQNTNAAVARQLEARGLRRDDAHPDVFITTRRSFVGTLIVDVTDADTGELMWRGLSQRDMHPTSKPEHRLERINKEVYKIFKKYPAGTVATSGLEIPATTDH